MIANPEYVHALIITKYRTDNSGIDIKVGQKSIKSELYVKLTTILDVRNPVEIGKVQLTTV